MSEIRSESEYRARFTLEDAKTSRRSRALDFALDIRKFEIDLYWKRAGYFWTLIAASFTAYFLLQSAKSDESLILLVSCLGFLLSLGWYLVNRGSKYWQENWERHVDLLESEVIGPLYKTTLSRQEFGLLRFWDAYPYSVSKINQLISLFVVLVWLGLAFGALPALPRRDCLLSVVPWLLAVLTLLFAIFLFTLGRGGSEGKSRRVNFRESQLDSTRSGDETP